MKENLINENANYIKSIESTSIENIDSFYFSLTDQIPNRVKDDFNDSVQEPVIMEMDINSMPTMKIAVRNKATNDIYNYVSNVFAKEIEKVSEVTLLTTGFEILK
jgi:multidrug efflux pump subunit AcrB